MLLLHLHRPPMMMRPLLERLREDEVATIPGANGSALALGVDWKCTGALPLGVPNANALRGQYPVMRHAHEKGPWRYVDGMGMVSMNPGVALVGESGKKLPCAEVAQVAVAAAAV